MNQVSDLKSFLQGEVTDSLEERDKASRDASVFTVSPSAVVYPKNNEDLKALVSWANKATPPVSLTARSGGTDMTGGPLTESVVVNFQKHFQKVGNVKNHRITVQPGVWYRDLEKFLAPKNLQLPSYPASKDICTVGGMVANNSGGEKTLVYGKTADYVAELKTILADGEEHTFHSLTRAELDQKMKLEDFEGNLYRNLFELLEKNYDLVQNHKPHVHKNSSGYALWDVWNRKTQTFDLTRLLTGSQGTLGLISEITFRLITPAPHTQMLVMFLRDLSSLGEIVKTTLRYAPEAFESYDDHTLRLALRFLPGLWRKMKTKNLLSLILSFIPEMKMMLTGGLPKLILLAEFTGHDPKEVKSRVTAAMASLKRFQIPLHITQSAEEEKKYWVIRRESFNLLRQHVKNSRTVPFIDDLIVPPESLPEFLPLLRQILAKYNLVYTIAGHVGDGNFHIIPLMDPRRPDFVEIIEKLSEEVYQLVFKFGGSITGEHNDGLIRSRYVKEMFGPEMYHLFEEVKKLFDPKNIFNPGKKVNADWNFAKAHIVKN